MNLSQRAVDELLLPEWRRGPVPLSVAVVEDVGFASGQVHVTAWKHGARGTVVVTWEAQALLLGGLAIGYFLKALGRAVDGALSACLIDHEMKQGWPPRECLHESEPD